jgi:hypoxanthine-guanine phosphoribosyltransferase
VYTGSAVPAVGAKYDFATGSSFDSDDTTGGYIQVVGNVDSTAKEADVILINRVFTV